jgi:hypothetical protein
MLQDHSPAAHQPYGVGVSGRADYDLMVDIVDGPLKAEGMKSASAIYRRVSDGVYVEGMKLARARCTRWFMSEVLALVMRALPGSPTTNCARSSTNFAFVVKPAGRRLVVNCSRSPDLMQVPQSSSPASADAARKRFETARARLFRQDVSVVRIDGDNGRPVYIATLGAWTKAFDTIEEVERLLERVEGAQRAGAQAAA